MRIRDNILLAYVCLVVGIVAVTVNLDFAGSFVDTAHFIVGIGDIGRLYIVSQTFKAAVSGDRHNPRFLMQQP